MLVSLFHHYDHEISLLSAIALLALAGNACFLFTRFLWQRIIVCDTAVSTSTAPKYNLGVMFLLAFMFVEFVQRDEGLVDLIQGSDAGLNEILDRVPLIRQGPSPPLLFRNRHIQFLPWLVQNEIHRQEGIPFQRIDVEVSDCQHKIAGCDESNRDMVDTITLDVFPPFDPDDSHFNDSFNTSSPVIMFSPGLRCYSQDLPGNMIIRKAFEYGFRVIVVNRRGHTPNQLLKSPRWNLFGDVDDLEQVYWYVKENLATADTPFFLHGISSGTSLTVTGLAKWDRRRIEEPHRKAPVFVSSIAMTPGYDISKVLQPERFRFPYNNILLGGVKSHFVVQNEDILRSHDSDAVDNILSAGNLQEFVDAAVPFAGYQSTEDYYNDTNPINEVRDVTTPKLVLNSIDDPCCKISNLYEKSPYPQHEGKTFAKMISETQYGIVAVTRSGSHCPFICSRDRWLPFTRDPLNGGFMLNSWADEVSIQYYRATLDVYGDRRFDPRGNPNVS